MSIRTSLIFSIILLVVLIIGTPVTANEPGSPLPTVDGVWGLSGVTCASWLAVKVAVPEGLALSGVMWYNNDELEVFPEILVGTGYSDEPGDVAEMAVLAEQISGVTSDWSALSFNQPVIASQGNVYVVFVFSEGSGYTDLGEGGGPGIGYCSATRGTPGWLSTDGETWMRVHRNAGFALTPTLIPLEEGMLVKSMDAGKPVVEIPPIRLFLSCHPNPFNPRTEIRFGLPQDSKVSLDIFDLRGRLIVSLVNEKMAPGEHSIVWLGTDGSGRTVASGAYLAQLRFAGEKMTRKLMLVR